MSLDKNLFTLAITPNADDPRVIDLVDPEGTVHYRKQRVPGSTYKMEVYDPMSESLLITATAPSAMAKSKSLELCNPTTVVELKYTGTLSFRWSFKWEIHEFEWKREECFIIRKPDPPVLVAVTKEPPGRMKTQSVQILDYNLNRFDIEDRKGLEIVLLTALLSFADGNEAYHSPTPSSTTPSDGLAPPSSGGGISSITRKLSSTNLGADAAPPKPPPKPKPKTGVDRIAELQALRGEVNEVNVTDEGSVDDYAQYCWNLLQDEAMLFISIRSGDAEFVPKVLQVVHETTRLRHIAGREEKEELHKYVAYDAGVPKGPKRINLDDEKDKAQGKNYKPPTNLTVHLSKIPMPELQPKSHVGDQYGRQGKDNKGKNKVDPKKTSSNRPSPPTTPPIGNPPKSGGKKLAKNNGPSAPLPPAGYIPRPRVHSHQTHPQQPSPSPSQLNNPSIYAAPPPSSPMMHTHASRPPPLPQSSPALNSPPANSFTRPASFNGAGGLLGALGLYPAHTHVNTPHSQPPTPSGTGGQGQGQLPSWPQTQGSTPATTAQKVVTGIFDRLMR